jgi:hypothetical protein
MKTPTWAIVIGVCLMLFGGCGVTKDIQSINMPAILEMQQEMMSKMVGEQIINTKDSLSKVTRSDTVSVEVFKDMAQGMQEMFAMSNYTKTWTVRLGYVGLLFSIIYILSGVFLLVKRSFSIKLVYAALILSIVFSTIESVVLASDSSGGFLAKLTGFGNTFGIVLDIILLVVVISMDKSAYKYPYKPTNNTPGVQ